MHYCHKELDKFQIYLEGGVAWLYLMFKGSFKMFYKPEDGHGLKHNPFNAIVTPRPIGWISTRDKSSTDNIAPYSFFNAVAYVPPQVMFASTGDKSDRDGTKDSVSNIRETKEFCVNIVSYEMRHQMNATSKTLPADIDEFKHAELKKTDCRLIKCPRVLDAPAALECKLVEIIKLPGAANFAVFGEVVGVHMNDDYVVDGKFDVSKFNPLTRLGYRDYSVVREIFSISRPDD